MAYNDSFRKSMIIFNEIRGNVEEHLLHKRDNLVKKMTIKIILNEQMQNNWEHPCAKAFQNLSVIRLW